MFRSLMIIIRELYLYLTKVIFMLKHSVKLRRYIKLVSLTDFAIDTSVINTTLYASFPDFIVHT